MLDQLRRHASSWIIKVVLGAIILTFVLFFGYSAQQGDFMNGGQGVVARVNKTPITENLYELFYDQNYDRAVASFKDTPVPDVVRQMVRQQTLRQLIFRTVSLEEAARLGVVASDQKLADEIVLNQRNERGEFDPVAYRHQFLPSFQQRFHVSYEDLVREDLTLQAFRSLFTNVKLDEQTTFLDVWMEARLARATIENNLSSP